LKNDTRVHELTTVLVIILTALGHGADPHHDGDDGSEEGQDDQYRYDFQKLLRLCCAINFISLTANQFRRVWPRILERKFTEPIIYFHRFTLTSSSSFESPINASA
jgi:hypothetical protein